MIRFGIVACLVGLAACGDSPSEPRPTPPDPEIRWIAPSAVIGGETVWIVGHDFGDDPGAVSVRFDGETAELVSVADSLVVAFVRAEETVREVTVELSVRGAAGRASGSFEIVLPPAPPGILTVEPDSVLGGDTLRVRGRHFLPFSEFARGLTLGNRGAGIVALSDTLLLALAPPNLAGTFPVVYERDLPTRATSFQRVTVVPAVAGVYDVIAGSSAPDSCGRGAELVAGMQAQPFDVEQDFAEVTIGFLGHVYRDVLDVNAFEAGREHPGTARVDSLLLAFVFPPPSSVPGTSSGATGAFVVRYAPGDQCNLRVSLFARRREEPRGLRRTIRSTYALDVTTVRTLDDLARRWGVSKSEALRRAIRAAAERPGPPGRQALGALEELQESLGLSARGGAAWARATRSERRASSRGSFADCLIAATALRGEAALATSNPADFRRLETAGLRVLAA